MASDDRDRCEEEEQRQEQEMWENGKTGDPKPKQKFNRAQMSRARFVCPPLATNTGVYR